MRIEWKAAREKTGGGKWGMKRRSNGRVWQGYFHGDRAVERFFLPKIHSSRFEIMEVAFNLDRVKQWLKKVETKIERYHFSKFSWIFCNFVKDIRCNICAKLILLFRKRTPSDDDLFSLFRSVFNKTYQFITGHLFLNFNNFRWKEIILNNCTPNFNFFLFYRNIQKYLAIIGVHFEWDPSEIFSIHEKKGEKKESITRYRRWWGGDKREDRGRNEKLIEPKAVTRLRVNWIFRFHDSSPSLFSFISFSFLFSLLSLSLSLFFSPRRNSMERGRKGCKLDSSGH